MAAPTVRVEGAERLQSTMHAAAGDLADMAEAEGRSGEAVANAARLNAPKRTGRLAASISASRDGAVSASGGGVAISADTPYARVIHNGSAARNITANPFLTRALGQQEPTVVAAYATEVDRIVGRIRGQ